EGEQQCRALDAMEKNVLVHCPPPVGGAGGGGISRVLLISSQTPTPMTISGQPWPIQSNRRTPSVLKRKSMPTIISTIAPTGSGRRDGMSGGMGGIGGTGGTGGTAVYGSAGVYGGGGGTGGA